MLSNHLIFCRPLLLLPSIFSSIRSFPVSWLLVSSGQSFGVSASASVFPVNIQGWFLLGLTDVILQCTGLDGLLQHHNCCFVAKLCPTLCDRVDCGLPGSSVHGISQARILEWVTIFFSRRSSRPRDLTTTTIRKHQFFSAQPSLWSNSHICAWLMEKSQLWLYRSLSAKWCFWFLICCLFFQRAYFNFMVAVTIHGDFGAQENKIYHCFHLSPIVFVLKWWDQMSWS